MTRSVKTALVLLLSALSLNTVVRAEGVSSSKHPSPWEQSVNPYASLQNNPYTSLKSPTSPVLSPNEMNLLYSNLGYGSLSLSSPLLSAPRPVLNTQQIIKTANQSTVTINLAKFKKDPKTGAPKIVEAQGTGFFVAKGVIATNSALVNGLISKEGKPVAIAVLNINGAQKMLRVTSVIARDPKHDIALLAVEGGGYGVSPLPLADGNSMQVGDETYVFGSPFGLQGTFTRGNISGFRRSEDGDKMVISNDKDGDIVQITNPAETGSNGSAVLNNRGEVVALLWGGPEDSNIITYCTNVRYVKGLMISAGVRP